MSSKATIHAKKQNHSATYLNGMTTKLIHALCIKILNSTNINKEIKTRSIQKKILNQQLFDATISLTS